MNRVTLSVICAILAALAVAWVGATTRFSSGSEIVFEAESPYQTVYVTREGNILALRTGSRFARTSFMDVTNPYRHVFEYTGLMMLALAYLDEPKSALVIGLGGGTVSKYLQKYYPDLVITNVEVDPVVADVAKQYFNVVETATNRIVVMDGRWFLARSDATYDLIFLDAYYGGYIPFHLLTKEFLRLVKDHLSANGVVVSNTWRSQKLYERESATWAEVFGHFDSYLGQRTSNRIVIATQAGLRYTPRELMARMTSTQQHKQFQEISLPTMANDTLDRHSVWPPGTPILTDDYAPVNLLVDPRQRAVGH